MADKKDIRQPNEDSERKLMEIVSDGKEYINIGKRKYTVGGLKKGTRLKVTQIYLDNGIDDSKKVEPFDMKSMKIEDKVMAKIAAAYLLNSWWSLYFLGGIVWAIYWRWLYYFRQYTDSDYMPLMILCKKKAEKQTFAYTQNITLATVMKMTTMTMTRAEVQRGQAELSGEARGQQQSAAKEA